MRVNLNDKLVITSCKNLKDFLQELNSLPDAYAVAVNGKIIPKSIHESTIIHEDDDIEVFALMAGG